MNSLTNTVKKNHSTELTNVKSYDDLHKSTELSIGDIKILLSCNHEDDLQSTLSHRLQKQSVLVKNGLFNPSRYFSKERIQAHSVQQSTRIHSARL